jgi:hypothetical protein
VASERRERINAMIALAQSEKPIPIQLDFTLYRMAERFRIDLKD